MKEQAARMPEFSMSRREAIGVGLAGIAVALIGCDSNPTGGGNRVDGDPHLAVQPSSPILGIEPGLHDLSASFSRSVLLYVPATYDPGVSAPLAVMLHGATGTAARGLIPFQDVADELGLVLLSPQSYGRTWDMILGRYGVDVNLIDNALQFVFDRVNVDPERLAIAGFSDGASYALALGTANGNLFRHIAAFSPGFLVRKSPRGEPHIFVSHGTQDQVLPIDECSRRIVPRLRDFGYEVDYREFDGPHGVLIEHARVAAEQIAGAESIAAT